MKATKQQSVIFCLGSLLVVVGLGFVWKPLALIAAGVWLITLAVLQFDRAKSERDDDRPKPPA